MKPGPGVLADWRYP